MHTLLIDRLCCPRCGPEFGLILLADEVADRRVATGVLGCSNCRDRFPVTTGLADLRPPPRSPVAPLPAPEPPTPDDAVALAAFLGITEGPAWVALLGDAADLAGPVAGLVEGLQVVAARSRRLETDPAPAVSRLLVDPRALPLRSGMFPGVALEAADDPGLQEALRILAPGARLVVYRAGQTLVADLEERGMEVLAHENGILVARGAGPRNRPSSGHPLPVVPTPTVDNS